MQRGIVTAYFSDFHSKMSQLRLGDRLCDISIRVGEKVFKCHRLVLISASEYFDAMFNGNFNEHSAQEVTLEGMDADVFEEVLKFVYTGEPAINGRNLYDIFRAADLYDLPHLIQLCATFGRENLNAIAHDVLNMFLYAHRAGMNEIAEFLKRHIYKNFDYFSNAPEFVVLSGDILLDILGAGAEIGILWPQDALFEGIYTWITHQDDLNPAEKKSYFERLCEKIDLSKLSGQYRQHRLPECMAVLLLLDESIDLSIPTPGVVQRCPKLLRAYVSNLSENQLSSTGTMIFSCFSSSDLDSLIYSGSVVDDCYATYMEDVVVDDHLYSLSFKMGRPGIRSEQAFRSSISSSMYPYTSLSLPPLVNEFDMCGIGNEIYLFDKTHCGESSNDSRFSRDELSHGLYRYKRDIDKWFALPRPKVKVSLASMTCDEERLYLIGGSNNQFLGGSNLVQAYDVRTREWSKLSPMKGNYSSAASCIDGKKIFVVGDSSCSSPGEIYDKTSGNSRPLTFNNPRLRYPKLVNWSDNLVIFDREMPRYLDPSDVHLWISMPNIREAVPFPYEYGILDMFNF